MNFYTVTGFDIFGTFQETWLLADSALEACEKARELEGLSRVAARKSFNGEWDCDNFTLGGHINHETGVLDRY